MTTPHVVLAVVLAVASAACFAVAAAGQHHQASSPQGEIRDDSGVSARLLVTLARRAQWRHSIIMTFVGSGLHIVALTNGPITLVQPIGVLTLVIALPIGARLGRHSVGRTQWLAAAMVVVGLLLVLVPAARSVAYPTLTSSQLAATAGAVAVVGIVAVLLAPLAGRTTGPVLLAIAAAVCFGATSGLMRVFVVEVSEFTQGALVLGPVLAVFAVTGMILLQNAYRRGGLGAPLAILTLVDPLAADIIGVVVLGEPLATSRVALVLGGLGILVVARGVIILTQIAPNSKVAPVPGTDV